ncbi:MAG: hypothetical protein JNM52_09790 [Betaproteobacteria bacterium]|nr:hypothetical protein [Betaproteobacteria bacterium]
MKPRTKLILLACLFAMPVIASSIAYFMRLPGAGSNYGELIIPPVPLPETKMEILQSGEIPIADATAGLRGKWLLVTRENGACEALCKNKLYTLRQARLILGRDMDRVARVVLVEDDNKPDEALLKEYAGTTWVAAKTLPWLKALPTFNAESRASIYIVDPRGNAFIRYTAEPDIKRLVKDIQRVLKASQIG